MEPKIEHLSEANKSMTIEERESKEKSEEKDEMDKSLNSSYMQDFANSKIQSNRAQMISFFNSYAMFINDASNIILDLDVVLAKLTDAITKLKPPEK